MTKYVPLREKVQFAFKKWHCFRLTTLLWNCSINPYCLLPRGKVKIFSNSFVLLIQQRLHVLHGRYSLKGASSCSRQQWINSYKWIGVHVNRQQLQQEQEKARKTSEPHVYLHSLLWDKGRSEINKTRTHSQHFAFSHSIKVTCFAL